MSKTASTRAPSGQPRHGGAGTECRTRQRAARRAVAVPRRHPDSRRLATLLATVVHLQTRAVDDARDLLDVLITSKLLSRAERESNKLR